MTPDDLDGAVHDVTSRTASDECNSSGAVDDVDAWEAVHDAAGSAAADINNSGVENQICFLLAQYDAADVEQILRDAAGDS